MLYGFSTGALAKGDFRAALAMLEPHTLDAIELSALRVAELSALLLALPQLELGRYQHVTVHAPSRFDAGQEAKIAESLGELADHVAGFIVHSEAIMDPAPWRALGPKVLVENADGRKRTGRTLDEFQRVMDRLPDARVCFDVAHAHQVDPSLLEARRILRVFRDRVAQLHVSQLNYKCEHQPLSWGVVSAFYQLAAALPDTAVILESVVGAEEIASQIRLAKACFERDEAERARLGPIPTLVFG
jgi:hypothetical protein